MNEALNIKEELLEAEAYEAHMLAANVNTVFIKAEPVMEVKDEEELKSSASEEIVKQEVEEFHFGGKCISSTSSPSASPGFPECASHKSTEDVWNTNQNQGFSSEINNLVPNQSFPVRYDNECDIGEHSEFSCSCVICEKPISKPKKMQCHTKKRSYSCNICNKIFKKPSKLNRHIMAHQKKDSLAKFTNDLLNHCHSTHNEGKHVLHERTEKLFTCSICNKTFLQSWKLKRHLLQHSKEPTIRCAACCKVFKNMSNLKRHLKSHTGDKLYSCSKCLESFPDSDDLINHQLIHKEDWCYKCCVCHLSLSSSLALYKHLSTHVPDKHPCSLCSTMSVSYNSLQKHIVVLENSHVPKSSKLNAVVRQYSCEHCKSTFLEPKDLDEHLRTHVMDNLYCCGVCEKTFTSKEVLHRHSIAHTSEFSCIVCHKSFSCASKLKVHQYSHTGERPFPCNICSKAFSCNSNLKRHIATHTGEGRYSCNTCQRCYPTPSELKRHLLCHDKGK